MTRLTLLRRAALLGLTANALRPARGRWSVPAFAAGWLTAELAPQLLAAHTIDTIAHLSGCAISPTRQAAGGSTSTSSTTSGGPPDARCCCTSTAAPG